jgi:predicted ATPase/transcriptional regulator with GAF, ATPase, and Fis domain
MSLGTYDPLAVLVRTHRHVVSRAVRRSDGVRVLLKEETAPSPVRQGALHRELELLRHLPPTSIPRPIEVTTLGGRDVLVLEDAGLLPVAARIESGAFGIDGFLRASMGLCRALAGLHDRGLVVGAINPQSILFDDHSGEVLVLDLSLAQRVPVDVHAMSMAALSPTTAGYVAPEQTGRISRSIDHRADLYAAGAVFYEMLTGRRPFDTGDPLELVHSHIARTARPPAAVVPLPEQLSRMIMRLLAKAAEDRYQSADGLRLDLERCAREWQDNHSIAEFDLGAQDFSDRLLIPERLYGRDAELTELTTAFDETLDGRAGLVLVGGYAGVGKTAFINELCRPIVRERGYFISGKFDQVARNVPYSAVLQAFRSLIWQVLSEREEQLAGWRDKLIGTLGANGGVLAAVLPEIEFIIGKQPPPVALDAVESQNRFHFVFRNLVRTFARPGHPLVMFLDDLQWVDAATLELLPQILNDPDMRSLLVIGAYRDNEITSDHALTTAIDRLERNQARVRRITLGPLNEPSLRAFLADSLRADETDVAGLAHLIRQKTDGNPFFVIQFLESLRHDRLLSLDRGRGRWTFRLDTVAAAATTDNVVTLMTQRIQRLSAPAQEVLRLAATIGNQFRWDTFVIATGRQGADAESGLDEALAAGLIRPAESQYEAPGPPPSGRGTYAFIHDRVQQAAYALIPEVERPGVHLGVGRQLLAESGGDVAEDRLFEIVNHLNTGRALIDSEQERQTLARLNLRAGRSAKASAAFRAAVDYLAVGIDAAGAAAWATDYALSFALQLERAECLYLAGEFEQAERAHAALLTHARSTLDEAAVHELRVTFYENRSRYAEAMASGRDGLALFGLRLASDDDAVDAALEVELDAIQRLLGERPIASLIDLPRMEDLEVRTAMRILTLMWAPVYISGNQRLTSLISATMVRLSLEHGNTEDSAYAYVTHAITVGPVRRRFGAAYEWGELAIAVNERFGDTKRRAKIHQQIHAHVKLWKQPFEACIPHAREAVRAGLEAGDFAYAGYGAATESWPALVACRDLNRFVSDYTPALGFLTRVNMSGFRDALRVVLNWVMALQGRTSSPLSLTNEFFDEAAFIERYSSTAPLFMTILRCARVHLCVVFDEVDAGLEAVERAREVTIPGTMWPVLGDFWGALALAAGFTRAHADLRARYKDQIDAAAASLNELAESCPQNFRCFSRLVTAERLRIEGAGRHTLVPIYDEAIAYAVDTNNLQQEALGCDLCARMLIRSGDSHSASDYLRRAYRAYDTLGAVAKTRQMQQRFPDLPAVSHRNDPAEQPLHAEEPALATLDVRSVVKVAQAIAGEIELESLLRTLLTIAVENAGAERGVFLQLRDGQVMSVFEAIAANDRVEIRRGEPDERAGSFAESVVRYVRRTRQDVVIADAGNDERFTGAAPNERSAQAVLCVPVAHQGRLSGILYLEHGLTGAFTEARTEMVRVLAAQAAIALENAQLYEEMKSEVERRAAAERALRDALAELEALKNRLEAENVYLQEEIGTQHNFNEIVGQSPPLLDALRRVERVAPTDSTVLILGETGCGKELFARAVHSRSRRNGRPLVKVNCGAIAPGLVESELFGHVKGAFTGAIDKRVGRFELANGGTIFLDEIGELPLEAQVKLLRVLQEQEFEPVGSSRTVRVSVRVIAATNRNLDHAVREGRFRADLLYRLNVFPIEIPPLRDRSADIPLLVSFFLSRIARTLGKPLQAVTARSMEQIRGYSWPGNVRELQNVLERAAILAEGPVVSLELALADQRRARIPEQEAPVAANLNEVQREHILAVLQSTGGVVEGTKGAATILGVHPNTLRSRMKKLGIRPVRN